MAISLMNIVHSVEGLTSYDQPMHLALGVFDGVHVGHQAVMSEAVNAAQKESSDMGVAGVVTFEPHPIRVLAPERAPRRILASIGHKAELLSDVGISVLCVQEFTLDFASVTAKDFITDLVKSCKDLRSISVGEDWIFGKDRGGNVQKLKEWGRELGFEVYAITPVMVAGERVSSTRIRQAVRDGNLSAAEDMLGRPYDVVGTVIEGKQLARQLGFPTANTIVHNEQLPPDGVWALKVTILDARWAGKTFNAIGNLGRRPTVEHEGARRLLEIHLFDFTGDIYGIDVEAEFVSYIRKEQKFSGIEELKAQIESDVTQVKASFNKA